MSMIALQQAVADRIKAITTLTSANVGVSYDGQPPAFDGEKYIQVSAGATRRGQEGNFLDRYFDIDVTVTRRTGYTPQDRIGQDTIDDPNAGMGNDVETLSVLLDRDYLVLSLVGGTMSDGSTFWTGGQTYSLTHAQNGFREPLKFSRADKYEIKGPDWFWSHKEQSDYGGDPPTGIICVLHFIDARRTQAIGSL